jgi:outer membrane protein assembly factor BamB
VAWDAATGQEKWRINDEKGDTTAIAVNTSPLVAENKVFFADGVGIFHGVDLLTGQPLWEQKLYDETNEEQSLLNQSTWAYPVKATPAYGNDSLFIPTQCKYLYSLNASDGRERWRLEVEETMIHPASYQALGTQAFYGSPALSGVILWAGGADGSLRAINTASGKVLWAKALQVPILSGVVISAPYLLVATYDGVVRAMIHEASLIPVEPKPLNESMGCSLNPSDSPQTRLPMLNLVALFCLVFLRKKRRRRAIPRREQGR